MWTTLGPAPVALRSVLSAAELERLEAVRRPGAAADYLVGHALLRIVLAGYVGRPPGELEFDRTCRHCGQPHGKPTLSGHDGELDFSLSHAGGAAVLAVSAGAEVGADIEPRAAAGPELDQVLRRTRSAAEAQHGELEGEDQLLRHWTRKEALLKASGHGLVVAPSAVTLRPTGPGRWRIGDAAHLDDPDAWSVADLNLSPALVGAVALHETLERVVMLTWG